ncbi:MAG: GyrI-like domain-containing protein [Candidatus Kapabacteria bacterium]|nr:GyrI-like domain-containing protein [Candidatus Kapabacteria bacterium]
MKYEWRKAEKKFYLPATNPELIEIPQMNYFIIDGKGNPNDEFFGQYIQALYTLSYSIKMSPKKNNAPDNYFDYTVYPLEGVWDLTDAAKNLYNGSFNKNDLIFRLMIRQPNFVNENYAKEIIEKTQKDNLGNPLIAKTTFETLNEGLCVQMTHIGSYDDEPASFAKMEQFCEKSNLIRAKMTHKEIYLSDPRRTETSKLKTALRIEVKNK